MNIYSGNKSILQYADSLSYQLTETAIKDANFLTRTNVYTAQEKTNKGKWKNNTNIIPRTLL